MKSDLSKIFSRGWGTFLLIALFVSVALELMPPLTLENGTQFDILRGGSPVLGWLLCISVYIVPALSARAAGIAPVRWWIALPLCFLAHLAWMAFKMLLNGDDVPVRPSMTMVASMIIMWRILRLPRSEDSASKPSIPLPETSPTKPPADASIHAAASATPTPLAVSSLPAAENSELQQVSTAPATEQSPPASGTASNDLPLRRDRLLLGGLLVILAAFGFYGISEEENPPLTWLLITCGIWSISIHLMPGQWLRWLRNHLNWGTAKKTMIYAASTLALIAILYPGICAVELYLDRHKKSKIITESVAYQVYTGFNSIPEKDRPRAASFLAAYRDQQKRLGLPLWPEKRKQRERARSIILDPLKLDEENGAYVQAERVAPGAGDAMRKRDAGIAWTAARYGVPENEVRERWQLYKADMSEKWGTGILDDAAFYARAKQEQQDENAKYLRLIFENPAELDRENAIFTRIDEFTPGAADKLRKSEASVLFLSYLNNLPEREARKKYDTLKAQTLASWKEDQLDDLAFFERIKAEIMKKSSSSPAQ